MYDEKIEALISAALADGVLTEKEKQVLFKRAQAEGIDLDEFEMVLDARLLEVQKAEETKLKAEIKEVAEKEASKTSIRGKKLLCPSCNRPIPSLATKCPYCSVEFSNIEANKSSQQLAVQLIALEKECEEEKKKEYKDVSYRNRDYEKAQIDAKYKKTIVPQRKRTLIETFPIPNTKSDLFEFITALLPKIGDKQLGKAYRAKVEECILKANTLFPNDPTFAKITNQAELDIKKHKQHKLIIILSIVCAAILIIGIPTLWGVTHSESYNNKKIDEYVNNGEPEKAVYYCLRKGMYWRQIEVSDALARKGKVDEALSLYLVSHSKDDYHSEYTTEIRKALIREKRYEEALEFTNYETYGLTIFWILQDYCNDGKKQEAHAFLKLHSTNKLSQYDDLFDKFKFNSNDYDKELRKYIDNY